MRQRIASMILALTCATVLLTVGPAFAQPPTSFEDPKVYEPGKVLRVDRDASVVILEDGRMYRTTPRTVIMVDNQPMELSGLQPGSAVVIRSAEPVIVRDGRYVVMTPPVTTVAAAPGAVVVATPAPPKQTVYGRVSGIERNGQVTVKTPRGEFEVSLPPDAARNLKKGDTVTIDVTFAPPAR